MIEAFLATGTLVDHWLLWSGDGRITAGHLAVLADRAAAGPLEVILFDGPSAPSRTGRIAMRRWPGTCWPLPPSRPARRPSPGTRTLPPAPSRWAFPWGRGCTGSGPGAGDPDQLRQRAVLQHPTVPVRPPRPAAAPDPAPPTARLGRPRPSHSAGGDRAPQIREMSVKGTRSPCVLHTFCDRSAQAEGYVVPESTRRAGADAASEIRVRVGLGE